MSPKIDFHGLGVARSLKTQVFKSSLTFEPGMHLDRFSAKGALYAKVGPAERLQAAVQSDTGWTCVVCFLSGCLSYANGVSTLKVPFGDMMCTNIFFQSNQRLQQRSSAAPQGPFCTFARPICRAPILRSGPYGTVVG